MTLRDKMQRAKSKIEKELEGATRLHTRLEGETAMRQELMFLTKWLKEECHMNELFKAITLEAEYQIYLSDRLEVLSESIIANIWRSREWFLNQRSDEKPLSGI